VASKTLARLSDTSVLLNHPHHDGWKPTPPHAPSGSEVSDTTFDRRAQKQDVKAVNRRKPRAVCV
jgi:hypothetical protein